MKRSLIRCLVRSPLSTLLLFIAVLVCSAGAPRQAWAHSSGMNGYSGNPATNSGAICNGCHSGGTTPTVVLTGPTTLAPSASGVYTLTITGGAANDGGLDVSTTAGTLQATGSNTKIQSGEVTQTSPVSFSGGSLAFTFTLVAPSSGSVTLYAAGLSANGSGSSGDKAAGTTLAVTVASASAPHIVVSDSVAPPNDHQIPFGTVTDGLTSDQTVTITNSGDANLVIGTIAGIDPLAAPFSITVDHCSGQTIAPAGNCTLTVHFAPTAAIPSGDTFDIPSNDSGTGTVTISVSGTGTAAPAPNIVITDSVAPSSDLSVPFGNVTDGLTSDQTVTITNSGDADLVIGTIAGINPLAAPFSITVDNCSGQTIAPAGNCALTVHFAPTAVTAFNDSFDIPSDDPDTPAVTVSVSGTGTAAPAPNIVVTDSVAPPDDHQIPFGTVTDGLTSDQTVTVTNNGNANLVISTIANVNPLADPFSITVDHCSGQSIAPAGNCTLTVRFAPTAAIPSSDSFDILSNDPDTGSVTVSVSGTGTTTSMPDIVVTDSVSPPDDHQILFGTVNDGLTSDQTVTITNNGNGDLVIGAIAGVNQLAEPFSITVDNCSGQTIAPAGNCTLTVRFAPTAAAPSNDSFDIPSDDPDTATVTISVSGTGTAATAPIVVVSDSVAPNDDLSVLFGNWTEGITSDQTVTITNNGNGDLVIGAIASVNPLAEPFSITVDNCSGQTIAPAGTCSLTVRFAPTAAALFSDSFDIPSNDPAAPSVAMKVSGTGLSSATNNPPNAPTLVSPVDGQTIAGTTATLQWNKSADPDNDPLTYHVFYCPGDPSASCAPVDVASNGVAGIYFAGSGLLFFGFVFTRGGRGRRLMMMLTIAMLLMTGALFSSCSKSSESSTPTTSSDFAYQASRLTSATTYYWRVVADDGKGGQTTSEVKSFTTQ